MKDNVPMFPIELRGQAGLAEVQQFQSVAYDVLTTMQRQNVFYCVDQYREQQFMRGGVAMRILDEFGLRVQAQAMLTPCRDVQDFIQVTGAVSSTIDIENLPGTFSAISNFLISPHVQNKRGLAGRMIQTCAENSLAADFVGFICVATNTAILNEALSIGCKIFSVTRDHRLDQPTFLVGLSRLHTSTGDTQVIFLGDEITLANCFDLGFAIVSIDWLQKTALLQQQVIKEFDTGKEVAAA